MKRVVATALLTACAWTLVAVWLERAATAPPEPAPQPSLAPVAPEPAARSEPPPSARRAAPTAAPRRAAASREPLSPAPAPDEPLVSLEDLLRVPPPLPAGPQSVEDEGARRAAGSPAAAGPKRLRLEYSRETLLDDVPTQPKRRRTDLGVSVRVDAEDRLRVRGGVRVDESRRSEAERESEATPTVGVEVRF